MEDLGRLARRVEDAQRALGAIRYGSVFRVGSAQVVLNPDSPLAAANFAATVTGSPAVAQETLALLPAVWAEADRPAVTLVDSPSSVPELGFLAEEAGYEATEEGVVLTLERPQELAEGEPGRLAVPLPERYEPDVAGLVADAYGYSAGVEARLRLNVGHRLDDARVTAFAAVADERLAGVVTAFLQGGTALVTDLAVDTAHRHRRLGRALASAAAGHCLLRGTEVVAVACEAGGQVERFWTRVGFRPRYDTVTYVGRVG